MSHFARGALANHSTKLSAQSNDGTVVEHWDVITPLTASIVNGNSAFSDLFDPSEM